MDTKDFCLDEYEILDARRTIKSPLGNYSLTIQTYDTTKKSGKKTWEYTKGTIKNIKNGEIVYEIYRNYSSFEHCFFIKENREWLLCGKTYTSQCFIDIDNKKMYDNSESCSSYDYCWTSNVKFNPSATLLIVECCIWGAPYDYCVYDISNFENGWPLVGVDCSKFEDINYYENNVTWLDDNTLEMICYRTKQDYHDDLFNVPEGMFDHMIDDKLYLAYKVILTYNGTNFQTSAYQYSDEYKSYIEEHEKE